MSGHLKRINTRDLRARFNSPGLKLIDVRSIDAYNGWRLAGEARGGHIPGAKALPQKWAMYLDWLDIVRSKGISQDDRLVLYGYDPEKVERVAARFARAGYTDVSTYHDFLDDWVDSSELPLERLERYRHLVPPEWLQKLISTGQATEYDNDRYVVCHAHYRNRGAYEEGHIPGAVEVDTNTLESPETWNRRSPEEIRDTLQQLGITRDTTVILYGRFSFPRNDDPFPGSSAGHLGAIRCAFIMMYAGVRDVRVLNGGLQSWSDAGLDITTDETVRQPVDDFGADIPARPELVIDTPEAKAYLRDDDKNLVSVRSWREFIGEVSGYNYIEKKGRIPGAVFSNCGSDAYHMENFRNLDHTSREYHEIAANWAEAGITPDKHNAFYCGTGWRGSEAFLNAWLMGWPHVSVYDGGWFEWSNQGNPFEYGIPESAAEKQQTTATEAPA